MGKKEHQDLAKKYEEREKKAAEKADKNRKLKEMHLIKAENARKE